MSDCHVSFGDTVFDLAVIIVNYRTPALSVDCLASLASEISPGTCVLVVDNASGDGSAERIEAAVVERGWSSWAWVIRSAVNGGFAAGNNLGIRSVRASAYLLLNSDTIVRPGALRGLQDAAREHPEAGIIGPGLLDAHGNFDQSFFRQPAPASELIRASNTGIVTRLLRRFDLILPRTERPLEVDWLGFACVLIRASVIDQVGLLDDGYFMYFEDIDYCRRARAAGWKILYWPEPKVVHLQGASSKVSAEGHAQRRAPRYYYEARARYFAKYYGTEGLWLANALWHLGRSISWPRELLTEGRLGPRENEARDVWINALRPLADAGTESVPAAAQIGKLLDTLLANRAVPRSQRGDVAPSHDAPLPDGASNANPPGIGLFELLAEDFRTHDGDPREPGFWAVAVHRLGNARMDVESKLLRIPLTFAYHLAFTGVNWGWGIDLAYTVKLGRRVRIWHHGGTVLGARAIGDDVHIRHNTTLGLASRHEQSMKPIIGNRVDIGAGAAILGAVTVADDCVIGANSVVLRDLPAGSTAFGVPARPVNLQVNGSPAAPAKRRSESDQSSVEPTPRGSDKSGESNVASR